MTKRPQDRNRSRYRATAPKTKAEAVGVSFSPEDFDALKKWKEKTGHPTESPTAFIRSLIEGHERSLTLETLEKNLSDAFHQNTSAILKAVKETSARTNQSNPYETDLIIYLNKLMKMDDILQVVNYLFFETTMILQEEDPSSEKWDDICYRIKKLIEQWDERVPILMTLIEVTKDVCTDNDLHSYILSTCFKGRFIVAAGYMRAFIKAGKLILAEKGAYTS